MILTLTLALALTLALTLTLRLTLTKLPCVACGELDSRDCVTCDLCGARCHP